jgi:hypothetical protein
MMLGQRPQMKSGGNSTESIYMSVSNRELESVGGVLPNFSLAAPIYDSLFNR